MTIICHSKFGIPKQTANAKRQNLYGIITIADRALSAHGCPGVLQAAFMVSCTGEWARGVLTPEKSQV